MQSKNKETNLIRPLPPLLHINKKMESANVNCRFIALSAKVYEQNDKKLVTKTAEYKRLDVF